MNNIDIKTTLQTAETDKTFAFKPIGCVRCAQKYRYEAPRQAVFANNEGIIRLNPDNNFEQAVRDLTGFDRLWVIYCFHLNSDWKPLVRPPVAGNKEKISVFATRSPHRPNPIGMSCVELVRIDGLDVHIRNFDMLNNTPVLDLKPYIPAADAFPEARTGWLANAAFEQYDVIFTSQSSAKAAWIFNAYGLDLKKFCEVQLSHDPLNESRKRISAGETPEEFTIACRTWRILFKLDEPGKRIEITGVKSGYMTEELAISAPDPYVDKTVHREFLLHFQE
jgi:tRNA-Thr(GGU) m(6)t(6)A37 methyltransferase TsaA